MVALRITRTLGAGLRVARGTVSPSATRQAFRPFVTTPRALATQGYGDGKGDPAGENPSAQPGASEAQQSAEHPGPAPPDVGKGSGGPTKAAMSDSMNKAASSEDASAQSGGSRSKEAKETGSSPTGGEVGGEGLKGPEGKGTPQPKIHNQAIPGGGKGLSEDQKAEVDRHNEEFEKRHDRASPAADDKVNKKFWKGP